MGGGRYILTLLLIVGLLTSISGDVWANDTRNRVLEQPQYVNYQLKYKRELIPWDSENINDVKEYDTPKHYNENLFFNIVAYKEGFKITEPLVFSNLQSTRSIPYFSIWGVLFMQFDHWYYSEAYFNGMTVEYENDEIGVSQITFSGLCNSASYHYFSGFDVYEKSLWNYTPNTKYNFYLGEVDTQTTSVSSSRRSHRFSIYYDMKAGKMVSLGTPDGGNMGDSRDTVEAYLSPQRQIVFYSPADDPSITVTNVTTDTATISWNTNNTNPDGTSYTLQYQVLKKNGNPQNEADWGTWNNILIGSLTTTTELATTASVFEQDNSYRLRVQVNHIGGANYYVYSDYVVFSTSADPAVRAAHEAAIAAQAAKKAAEDTLQYSTDAKEAAQGAETKASEAVDLIRNLKTEFTAMLPPNIKSVKGLNGATATTNGIFPLVVSATNAEEYRAGVDGVYTEWGNSQMIEVPLLGKGVKSVEIQARKGDAVDNEYLTVFNLSD